MEESPEIGAISGNEGYEGRNRDVTGFNWYRDVRIIKGLKDN